MKALAHTIDEGLAKFQLVRGAGDGKTTACAMSLLNWIWRNGDEWSDSPECAHPLIRSVVINVNDAPDTTPELRAEIVRAGEHGILDTWWVPTEVVVWALSREPDAEPPSDYDRALTMVQRIGSWKATKERPNLAGAYLAGANLTDAYLARANLTGAYLAGANLADANLTGANLTRANLTGAYLAGANLADAYLADANLTGANLTGANLADANLTRANLTDANLTDAYLADANLTRANLTDANLTDAYLVGANLTDANLTDANLTGATGNGRTTLPPGWIVNETGLIVKVES